MITTGSPSSFYVDLEGSLDGTNWFSLGTISGASYIVVGDYAVRYVRANLSGLTGGTNPTVTAWIGSA